MNYEMLLLYITLIVVIITTVTITSLIHYIRFKEFGTHNNDVWWIRAILYQLI